MRIHSNLIPLFALLFFLTGVGVFVFVTWKSISGLLLYKTPTPPPVTIDETLTKVVSQLEKTPFLTASNSSVTLTTEPGTITVEIINGSGVAGAARTLAEQVTRRGFTVSRIRNGTISAQTIVSLKPKANAFRSSIVSDIGTSSATIQFQTLENSYPYDVRITLGQ